MRGWTLLLALCLAAPGAGAGDTLRLPVSGAITVAPDGTVHNHVLGKGLPPAVESLVSAAIGKWEFEPVVRNGVPAYARSLIHMTLQAKDVPGGYQLRVEDVRFSGYRQPALRESPEYPRGALRMGIEALVLVAQRIDADGAVLDTAPVQTTLTNVYGEQSDAERWRRDFEEAAVNAAKRWRYRKAEPEHGDPLETTIVAPVTFRLARPSEPVAPMVWHRDELRGARHAIPWLHPDQQQFVVDGLADGRTVTLDSPVALKTPVRGMAL